MGTYVKEHSVEEWLDYYRLREALELVAVRRVAEIVTDEQLAVLQHHADAFDRAARLQWQAGTHEHMLGFELDVNDADNRSHRALIEFSDSPLLASAYHDNDIHATVSIVQGRSSAVSTMSPRHPPRWTGTRPPVAFA